MKKLGRYLNETFPKLPAFFYFEQKINHLKNTIHIPEQALVLLVGLSGSGKSTFARQHFLPTEIVSSDHSRALISNDENDQSATQDAFELVHFLIKKRLKRGLLTVVDATNLQEKSRQQLRQIARDFDVQPVLLVFNIHFKICKKRNELRTDRRIPHYVLNRQSDLMRRSIYRFKKEGFRKINILSSEREMEDAIIKREKLYNNKKELTGPFDIIGDVHGCIHELEELLEKMGYKVEKNHLNFLYNYKITPRKVDKRSSSGTLWTEGPIPRLASDS